MNRRWASLCAEPTNPVEAAHHPQGTPILQTALCLSKTVFGCPVGPILPIWGVGVRWGLAKEKRTKGAPMTRSSPARSERQPAKEACQFFPFDPQPVPRARRRFSTLLVQYPRSEFDGSYKRLICRDLLVGKDGRFSKPLPKGDKPRNPSLQIVDLG